MQIEEKVKLEGINEPEPEQDEVAKEITFRNDSKKSKGRPNKKRSAIQSEESVMVRMSQQTQPVMPAVAPETISFSDIQQRWGTIFQKYANNLGLEAITAAYKNQGSFLSNPFIQNARVKSTSTKGRNVDKKTLQKALGSPLENEQILRAMSVQLYYQNYVYQNLIRLNRNVPKYNYYFEPLYVEQSAQGKTKLRHDSMIIDKAMKKLDPKLTFKTIAEQVYIEGKCTYIVRTSYTDKDVNYFVLQKLNSDNVKITGFGSTERFITSFDMSLFLNAGYSVEQYPKFIQDAWRQMNSIGVVVSDTSGLQEIIPSTNLPRGHRIESIPGSSYYHYWVELPQDLAWTFYSTGANAGQIPDFVPMFQDFKELDDYRWLMGQLVSKGVTSIITGEVPLAYQPKDGLDQTALTPDVILGYTDLFNKTVSENVVGFFAPFTDYKLHNVDNQPDNLNILYTRTRDLIATAGESSLVSISEKPSISSTQTARMLAESNADYITAQFEEFVNYVINNSFDLSTVWRVVLHGGIFNWREDAKMLKELVKEGGMKGLLPRLLSYFDETVEDYRGGMVLLDALDIKLETEKDKEFEQGIETEQIDIQKKAAATARIAAKASKTSSTKEAKTSGKVGRPAKSEDSITSDNTASSRDSGANVSENKKYAKMFSDSRVCPRCGNDLTRDEYGLCQLCYAEISEFYDETGGW